MKAAWLSCFVVAALMAGEADLAVSINGSAPEVRSGSPLLIAATLGEITDASWAASIAVRITAEDGSAAPLTVVLRTAAESNGVGRALWTVSPDEVRKLAPGWYTVHAGAARTTFRAVLQEAVTEAEREQDVVLQARYHQVDGQVDESMKVVDAWLAVQPASVAAWVVKADLHESAGQWREALACVNRAIKASAASDHGPVPLLRRQARLLERQ